MRRQLLCLLCSAQIVSVPVLAQSGTATITGTVSDQTGAVVPGVRILARDPATGFTRETVSNDTGNYSLPGLRPAGYDITAESSGFRKYHLRNFLVEVGQTARLDVRIEVGEVTQEVEVAARAQLLQVENASLGAVIDKKKMLDLPLNGRNFVQLAMLVPGVNTGQPGAAAGGGVSIGGTRSEQNAFQLDGVSNSDQWDNNITFRPNLDSVQEFRIEVNNYAAEFGSGAGGQINVVTRGGTNKLHGSLYEFHRNDAVQAKNFFQRDPNFRNSRGQYVAPPFIQNQFGGTVAGPVVKDRTMFFIDYEGLRRVRGQTGLRSVPDDTLKRGDFSPNLGRQLGSDSTGRPVYANQLFDPFSSRPITDARTNRTLSLRDPFPGNRIPVSRFDPVARKVLERGLWPEPNIPGSRDRVTGNPRENYADGRSRRDADNQFSTRIDHRFSDRDSLFGRYSFADRGAQDPGSFPGQERFNNARQQFISSSYTRTISPTIVNELRFGYQRVDSNAAGRRFLDGVHLVKELGIRGLPLAPAGAPTFTVGGFTGISDGNENVRVNNTFHVLEQFFFSRGRHFFKLGFEVRRIHQDVINNPTATRGDFVVENAEWTGLEGFPATGNTFANFLLGLTQRKTRRPGDHSSWLRSSEYAGFFQDEFKVSPKWTINYGVRYQLYVPPKETRDRISVMVMPRLPGSFAEGGVNVCKNPAACAALDRNLPALGLGLTLDDLQVGRLPQVMVAGRGVPRSLTAVEKRNFGPRLGIAYRPTSRLALRTGYGIFFDTSRMSYFQDAVENLPFVLVDGQMLSIFQFGLPPAEAFFGFLLDNPPIESMMPGPNDFQLGFKNSYVQHWNFGLQQQVGKDLALEISYAGNKATRLNVREWRNPAEPRANALIPATVHPQLRRLIPFAVLDGKMLTLGNWFSTASNAFSNYHSLMARLEKRFSRGLTFINGFTWSKAISDAQPMAGGSNDTGNRIQDLFNRKAEKGLAPFDHRFRLVSSFLYDLPFGRGRAIGGGSGALLNRLIGGWQVNGIATFQSGYPITVLRAGDPLGAGTDGAARPDMICNPNLPGGQRTIDRYFNTACFVAPPDRFGNAGRAVVTGPGVNLWDLAVLKNVSITEKTQLQFRCEFFNAFNHPNWNQPGRNIGSSGFGVVSSAQDPRIIQFGLKVLY